MITLFWGSYLLNLWVYVHGSSYDGSSYDRTITLFPGSYLFNLWFYVHGSSYGTTISLFLGNYLLNLWIYVHRCAQDAINSLFLCSYLLNRWVYVHRCVQDAINNQFDPVWCSYSWVYVYWMCGCVFVHGSVTMETIIPPVWGSYSGVASECLSVWKYSHSDSVSPRLGVLLPDRFIVCECMDVCKWKRRQGNIENPIAGCITSVWVYGSIHTVTVFPPGWGSYCRIYS